MGLYGKMKARVPMAVLLAAVCAVPSHAADKPAPPEDNDATYELPMYIPKIIQQKMVDFGDDDTGNDELYTMDEPAPKKPVVVEDNDNTYVLPGEYSPLRNKIKPIYKPPVRKPVAQPQPAPQPIQQPVAVQPVPQPVAQPQQYQQPVPQYHQPVAQHQIQPQQPIQQQYQYYQPSKNVTPQDNEGSNYPNYYQ